MNLTRKTPWHLWVVGVLALLWNAGGANDYIQTQSGNRDYIGPAADSYGISTDAVIAYYESWPIWAHSLWAIAIWGSVLGSVLLLFRKRFAYHSFGLSFLSMSGIFAYRAINPLEGVEMGPVAIGMTAAIFIVAILLIIYARRMTAKGVLT